MNVIIGLESENIMSIIPLLEQKIETELHAIEYIIKNDSEKHQGHVGYDGSGESHFRMTIRSKAFDGLSRMERQRLVHQVFSEELKHKIHALSLKLLASDE